MQADHVFRTLGGTGNFGDGNGRGVGSKDRVLVAVGFHVLEHPVFQAQVFEYGFHHQVQALETAVIGGVGNAALFGAGIGGAHGAFLGALVVELADVFHAMGQAFVVPVFQAYRQLGLVDGGQRDAGPHQAGTEDTDFFHVPGFHAVGHKGLFLQGVGGVEDAAQLFRLR